VVPSELRATRAHGVASRRCPCRPVGRALNVSARQRSRYSEPWKHAVLEAGHGADPITGEAQNIEPDPVADAGGGAQVGPECRLTVASKRLGQKRLIEADLVDELRLMIYPFVLGAGEHSWRQPGLPHLPAHPRRLAVARQRTTHYQRKRYVARCAFHGDGPAAIHIQVESELEAGKAGVRIG
jgi:hypothetical protein